MFGINFNREEYTIPPVRQLKLFPEPKTLNDIFLAEPLKSKLIGWFTNLDTLPSAVLLHGPAGVGKTSVPRILIKTPGFVDYSDYTQVLESRLSDAKILYIDGSLACSSGVRTLEDALEVFHKQTYLAPRTILVIDEAHDLTKRALSVLKAAAEHGFVKYENSGCGGHIIFISTKPQIADEQLMTRITSIDMGHVNQLAVVRYAKKALRAANIEWKIEPVRDLWLETKSPRKFFNELQSNIVDGKLILPA